MFKVTEVLYPFHRLSYFFFPGLVLPYADVEVLWGNLTLFDSFYTVSFVVSQAVIMKYLGMKNRLLCAVCEIEIEGFI